MPTQEDIRHQQERLEIHRTNLQLLLKRQSVYGLSSHTSVGTTHDIQLNRREIAHIKGVLRGWGVPVEDHADDVEHEHEAPPASQPPAAGGSPLFQQTGWTVNGNVYTNSTHNERTYTNSTHYEIIGSLGPISTRDDLLAALRAFKAELDKAKDVPAETAEDVRDDVDGAIKAIDRAAPDKGRAGSKLESAKKLLADMAGAAPSALALGNLLGQAIAALPGLPL